MWTFTALDTESTGPDPLEARILEIGFQEFANQQATKINGAKLYNPGCPIPQTASAVNGIRDEHIKDKPRFADSAVKFAQFLKGRIIVGYNFYSYDGPLIKAECARAKVLNPFADLLIVDLYPYIREQYGNRKSLPRSKSLKDQCAYFGVQLIKAHSAMDDARATGELLLAMQVCRLVPMDLEKILKDQETLRQQFTAAEQNQLFEG